MLWWTRVSVNRRKLVTRVRLERDPPSQTLHYNIYTQLRNRINSFQTTKKEGKKKFKIPKGMA